MGTNRIEPTQAAYGADGTDGIDDGGAAYLTPDALLAYCQSRMRNIDDQANGIMAQEQRSNTKIEQLHALEAMLSPYASSGITDAGTYAQVVGDQNDRTKCAPGTVGQFINQLEQEYPELTTTLEKDWKTLTTNAGSGTDTSVSTTDISQVIQDINGAVSDVNSGSELQMINLQSLMSQRQTAIQLTTNLIQSMDDTCKAIAQNVGK